jgi:hypothetical protein
MKSIYETELNISQAKAAELYANPENSTKWMSDIKKYEPLSGRPGTRGSKFRLIPKKGKMIFTATILSRELPKKVQLKLEASNVNVLVTGKFTALSHEKTKFVSEEEFTFKGIFNKLFGLLARSGIKKAHHKHMDAFKKFASTANK